MSKAQIKWASKHDWFVTSTDGDVVVIDDNVVFTFSSFYELRVWAGY